MCFGGSTRARKTASEKWDVLLARVISADRDTVKAPFVAQSWSNLYSTIPHFVLFSTRGKELLDVANDGQAIKFRYTHLQGEGFHSVCANFDRRR